MVITSLLKNNKDGKLRFFEEIFLLTDISMDVTFEMLFLTLCNVQIEVNDWKLRWGLYTPTNALFTT